jgi:alpha-tubulin suppressor-like RCC1 family protein
LFNNGELWAWGSYGNGGRGDQDNTAAVGIPRRVQGLQDIKIVKVSASVGDITGNDSRHVLALDDQGFVYSWGQNDVGQLGQGDTQNRSQAARIPRTYFNGEKIIDVLAVGGASQCSSYVRTAQDNIWAWGYNANGQLGQANTNNYYRPTKLLAWTPATYGGIRKWQGASWSSNGGSFQILDGQGYMWMCGDDNTQHSGTGLSAGNRTTITRALNSVTPNGTITNFWTVWAQGSSNKMSFFRTSGGQTYVSGIGGSGTYYVNGLSASVAQITTPTIIPAASGIVNIKEVWLQKQGTLSTVTFLRDDGRVYNQGYNGYGLVGNPYTGTSNNTVDDTGSTSYPVQMFLPPATKIVQILPGGSFYSSQDRVHNFIYLTEAGQLFAIGMNRVTSGGRNIAEGSFVTPSVYFSEGSAVNTPHLMMQGK